MPRQRRSFEEMVLDAREQDRQRYAAALANLRGPMPFGKTLTEDQQDALWAHTDRQYEDSRRFLLLTLPKEQGGQGLTPLAASYLKYPARQQLIEGAGQTLDEQIAYATTRKARAMKRQQQPPQQPPPTGEEAVRG